jgi:hypothetical protein
MAVKNELDKGRKTGILLPTQVTGVDSADFIGEQRLVPQIPGLGRGEREVLSLSMNWPNSLALLDDG